MIRVGDRVVPFFDMNRVGTVMSFEVLGASTNLLTTEGTTSMIKVALIKMDSIDATQPPVIQKFKVDDLLKADM